MKSQSILFLLFLTLLFSGCAPQAEPADDHDHEHEHSATGDLSLPELAPLALDGRKLNVVATTNIIGDVVGQVGRDAIELTTLLGQNQDPHSYEATPADLVALEQADIIFVNGWDLEEQLAETIEENFADKMIPISAGIDPRTLGAGADPHVWFSIHNVEQWAENTAEVLHELDPANAEFYEENSVSYLKELEVLEGKVDQMLANIPTDGRKLVTNHDALGYFAADYDFEVIGTVIPAVSTSAEPSARDLASLVELMQAEAVCTIFGESTQSQALAQTVAAELSGCDEVQVLSLYTGSLGDSPADSYIGMFRANVDTIVAGSQK